MHSPPPSRLRLLAYTAAGLVLGIIIDLPFVWFFGFGFAYATALMKVLFIILPLIAPAVCIWISYRIGNTRDNKLRRQKLLEILYLPVAYLFGYNALVNLWPAIITHPRVQVSVVVTAAVGLALGYRGWKLRRITSQSLSAPNTTPLYPPA